MENLFKKRSWISIFALLMFSFGSLSHGAMEKKHWEFNLNPGFSLPGGNNNDLENQSLSVEGAVEYMWSRKWSAGFEVGHDFKHRLDGTYFFDFDGDGVVEPLKAQSDESLKVFRMGPFIKMGETSDWGTWGVRYVRRYFVFGTGVYRKSNPSGEYTLSGESSDGTDWEGVKYPFKGNSTSHWGLNLGVGFEVEVWSRGIMGFDIRFHSLFQSGKNAQYWIPSLKFGYIF